MLENGLLGAGVVRARRLCANYKFVFSTHNLAQSYIVLENYIISFFIKTGLTHSLHARPIKRMGKI
jgi:hypothetical protein